MAAVQGSFLLFNNETGCLLGMRLRQQPARARKCTLLASTCLFYPEPKTCVAQHVDRYFRYFLGPSTQPLHIMMDHSFKSCVHQHPSLPERFTRNSAESGA